MPSLKQRLSAALSDVPVVLQVAGVLGSILVVAIPGIGHLAHRHRLLLLGLPEGVLHHAPEQLAITGVTILWRLPWRMLLALVEVSTPIFWSALSLLVFAIVLVRRARAGLRPSAPWSLGLLVFVAWSSFFVTGLITRDALEVRDLSGPDVLSRAHAETDSWLEISSAENRRRREALAGLVGWLSALAAASAYLTSRLEHAGWRRGLLAGYALILLFLAGQLPRAHAYAYWGLEYPRAPHVSDACDPQLSRALACDCVTAWHVSVDSRDEYILVRKDSTSQLRPLTHPEGGRCASLGAPSIVGGSGSVPNPRCAALCASLEP